MRASTISPEQFLSRFQDFLDDYRQADLTDTTEEKRLEKAFAALKKSSFHLSEKSVTLPGMDGVVLQRFFKFGAQKYTEFCKTMVGPLLARGHQVGQQAQQTGQCPTCDAVGWYFGGGNRAEIC